MKKNYKKEIAKCWVIIIISLIIASASILAMIIYFDLGLGWALVFPVLGGMILITPIALRMENKINHYKKMNKKEN